MTIFTMKSRILRFILPTIVWLFFWQILAVAVGNTFLFPGIAQTSKALLALLGSFDFYKAIFFSVIRVSVGLSLGIVFGAILAIICHHFLVIKSIVSPAITVIKSTPVASFIVVLWVMMSGNVLSVFIALLMVMPIIWQSVMNSFSFIDEQLDEVAKIFEFSTAKRYKLLILPTTKKFLVPAIVTSCGLAWKAEIAAEIIAYTKNSIGQGINDAKYSMDTPTVFAWTIIIIIFSIILERVTKYFLRRTS